MINSILLLCFAFNIERAFTFVRAPLCPVRAPLSSVQTKRNVLFAAGKDDESLLDAEDAAAFDAHDLSDPGMEAAAMERAVMMAEEFKSSHKKLEPKTQDKTSDGVEETTASQAQYDDSDSLLEAEEAAAFDAHDLSDAGMEAAAMERAVMMADEMKKKQS
jgi:hypothetical protein